MRARIALRKVNINLTDGAVTKEVGNIKEHKGIPVNVNDIIAAFSRGDEVHFNALYYVKTLTWAVGNWHYQVGMCWIWPSLPAGLGSQI